MYRMEISNLTKYYGDKLVLDDINLNIEEHEVVCLIGTSGSGKSTLLRCVNDLVEFDNGEIKIDGISIHSPELPPIELYKRVGIVFQSYNLFPTMTVLDNIILAPCKVHGADRRESEEYAHDLLGLFGLESYSSSYPEQLSGGQLFGIGR